MSEVVLRLDNNNDIDKIMQAISPYFQTVSITTVPMECFTHFVQNVGSPKIWDGDMAWLGKPWNVDASFKPLTRAEIYDR
jgi:hypothetical protein